LSFKKNEIFEIKVVILRT